MNGGVNMKRFAALLLSITLLCGVLLVPAAAVEEPAFSDVPENAWYADSVAYAVENGLFFGVGEGRFAPQAQMTRAMVVAVLWRHAGRPADKSNVIFGDVPKDAWYADAVQWAQKNEIIYGNVMPSETADGNDFYYGWFDPERAITREELATVLYRYARYAGASTEERTSLDAYPDGNRVSEWAAKAVQWCVARGYLCGSKTADGIYLLPRESATRAQVAAMLMRLFQSME